MTGSVEPPASSRVAILLSTYNGEQFLGEQLASLQTQTYQDWLLYWRDDGSTDATPQTMADYLATLGVKRSFVVATEARVGASRSFLQLLRKAHADGCNVMAFADQDDVWLPEKLERGLAALNAVPAHTPALYCARQVLVDAALRRIATSPMLRHKPAFPGALTQNIATGCTLMLNRAASGLIATSRAPDATLHDWWSYLVVAAAGGELLFDANPVVLYRQHEANMVGAPSSLVKRGLAAMRRGPESFMNIFRQNVAALANQPELLSPTARVQLAAIARGLNGSTMQRYAALRTPGLIRQTWPETTLFRLWFMLS